MEKIDKLHYIKSNYQKTPHKELKKKKKARHKQASVTVFFLVKKKKIHKSTKDERTRGNPNRQGT
jgi:hypothetical protein